MESATMDPNADTDQNLDSVTSNTEMTTQSDLLPSKVTQQQEVHALLLMLGTELARDNLVLGMCILVH